MGKPRVPRTRAGETWTESQYWSFVRSGLRQKWSRYPVRFQVLQENRKTVKGKRHKYEYQCAICTDWYLQKQVEVDHYPNACGSLKTYEDLPRFVKHLFCEADNLRVLCKPCHKAHTKKEREEKKNVCINK